MKIFKFITHPLFLVILLTLPTIAPFFNSRFFYTQDYIFIARLHQISTALADGQFPVRWVPDLRFGEPLFNFYAPLPYYIGSLIHLLGFNYIWVAKILFILSTCFSAIAMYIFSKKFFGTKASILSSLLYVYAPYRAVDTYVRGALSETWAFVFFPLIFYTSTLLAEKFSLKNLSFLSLSLAGLFLTHNVTTLIFLPFLGLWWLYLLGNSKKWKLIIHFVFSLILSLGLAAFFLLPAIFEKGFIQTKYLTVGYFNFRAHFVAYKQFFSTFWGYGSSLWGLDDGLSFQIGLTHWLILILAALIGFRYRKNIKLLVTLIFLGSSFLLSLFFQHNKSAFIWEAMPLMAFIQFPWRFLSVSIFLVAITGAVVVDNLTSRLKFLYFALIILVVVMNISYFRPKEYADDSFFEKFLDKTIMQTGRDLTKDYLPIWVEDTDVKYFSNPTPEKGEISSSEFSKRSNSAAGVIEVKSEKAVIELPISYFPGWEVRSNDQIVSLMIPSENGLVRFPLPKGVYNIQAEFKDTPIRSVGNYLTLGSVLIIILFLGMPRFKFK